MKKIILTLAVMVMCISLAGCGASNNSIITNLGNQIDETANVISSIESVNPTDLNLSKEMLSTIATKENSSAIYDNVIATQQTLLAEEYFKTDILNTTARIKNTLSKDIKLSKAQSTALKELTDNLSKYTNSVAYTKNDMESTIKNIASLKKNATKNADRINAKLNRLACNSNSRSSFYENILSSLNQIENYLNIPQEDKQEQPNEIQPVNQDTQTENIKNEQNTNQLADSPYTRFNSNNINRMRFGYGYGMNGGYTMPMTPYGNGYGMYGYGNTMYGPNGMNNMYAPNEIGMFGGYNFSNPYMYGGNNMNFARFNALRNTDTYAPLVRNIDTYRTNTENKSVDLPEKRLETYEKVNEDNTVEMIDNKDTIVKNETECQEEFCETEEQADTQVFKQLKIKPVSKKIDDELSQPIIAH